MCMAMQIFGLVSLKRWLPMNHRELPELLEIEFEAILPGRNQHDQRYTQHPIIRNFLDETVREFDKNCGSETSEAEGTD